MGGVEAGIVVVLIGVEAVLPPSCVAIAKMVVAGSGVIVMWLCHSVVWAWLFMVLLAVDCVVDEWLIFCKVVISLAQSSQKPKPPSCTR